MTVGDCIRIALESNPQTRSTWQAIRSAAARVGEEKSAYLPSADFSAGAGRQKQVNSQKFQAGQSTETDDLFDAAFGLSYLLFDGGQRSARVSRARADLRALGFQHNTTLQEVALQVARSYYSLLASRWSLQVAEETLRNAEYHVRLARARFDNGLAPAPMYSRRKRKRRMRNSSWSGPRRRGGSLRETSFQPWDLRLLPR